MFIKKTLFLFLLLIATGLPSTVHGSATRIIGYSIVGTAGCYAGYKLGTALYDWYKKKNTSCTCDESQRPLFAGLLGMTAGCSSLFIFHWLLKLYQQLQRQREYGYILEEHRLQLRQVMEVIMRGELPQNAHHADLFEPLRQAFNQIAANHILLTENIGNVNQEQWRRFIAQQIAAGTELRNIAENLNNLLNQPAH